MASAFAMRDLQILRRVLAEVTVHFNSVSSGPRVGTLSKESLRNPSGKPDTDL